MLVIIGFLSIVSCKNQKVKEASFHDWALTPPMGWNSWDCFGPSVTEDEVKANADYMAANLNRITSYNVCYTKLLRKK